MSTLRIFNIIGVTPTPEDDENAGLAPLVKAKSPTEVIWKANNIILGNSVVGTLHAGDARGVAYHSPASVPTPNPVALSAELKGLTYTFNGITFKNLKLVSNVLVYDNAYEVTVIHHIDADAGSVLQAVTYDDSSRFVINLNGKETKIIEKENKNVDASWDYNSKCAITKLKGGTGNVHIIGAKSIKVTPPADPKGNAWVDIQFIKAPSIMPLLQFKCPPVGGGKQWFTTTNAQANAFVMSLAAYPQQLTFEAKEGEQVIEKSYIPGTSYKIIIKQIKEEE